jgi:hypothetical protein
MSAQWLSLKKAAFGCGVGLMLLAWAAIPAPVASAAPFSGCRLGPGGQIRHVIVLQFDNTHLRRDNPHVPSDIEQIPALYDFMKNDGTLLSNDHTVLISHTADGIISTETGLYPGENGTGVANTFPFIDPEQTGTHNSASSSSVPGTSATSDFTYWTDLTSSSDPLYTLINQGPTAANPQGLNTPAPWAAFTRAGCDFGGIGSADMEFENDTSDLATVYGRSSPQYEFGNWSYNTAYDQFNEAGSNLGETDYEGLAIHCSLAESAAGGACAEAKGGEPDRLPGEPGGYPGYNALFGALNVNPALTGKPDQTPPASYTPTGDTPPPTGAWLAPPIYDVFAPNATNTGAGAAPDPGNVGAETTPPPSSYERGATPTTEILDSTRNGGFPGFDGMEANNALGYTAAVQEAGVPVTYTYLADVHDDHYSTNHGNAFGPGEAGDEAQLREYNAAFEAFFKRLAAHGIDKSNTVFLVTVDEGDHYAGGPALNPGCNGTAVTCQYDTEEAGGAKYETSGFKRNEGEIDLNLPSLLEADFGIKTKFGFDDDDAPAIIVPNQTSPKGPRPGQDEATVRALERAIGAAKAFDPINASETPVTVNLADETEEQILHMVNADPNRTPTFTLFGNPDFYIEGKCTKVGYAQGGKGEYAPGPGCPSQEESYAWNHGDIQPEIANTWQGWVGPGIRNLGETSSVWTDHADVRPTLLTLLGLGDDYTWDGRAVSKMLDTNALPLTMRAHQRQIQELGDVLKQLDAPFGEFAMNTLSADTKALESQSPEEKVYTGTDAQLQTCDEKRQALAGEILSVLQGTETGTARLEEQAAQSLTARADALIADASTLASDLTPPAREVCG